MSSIYQSVTLSWAGESYEIKPDFNFLHKIEEKYSLSSVAMDLAAGRPKMTHVAGVVAIMLRTQGVKVKDEEVYQELMTGGAELQQEAAMAIIVASSPKLPESAKKA